MNLVVGTLIACPSGVALAVALASDISAPFVGVAISAALLPPIVNAGITAMMGKKKIKARKKKKPSSFFFMF